MKAGVQVSDDGWCGPTGNDGGDGKWSESGHLVKAEPRRATDRPEVACEGDKEGSRMTPGFWQLEEWSCHLLSWR